MKHSTCRWTVVFVAAIAVSVGSLAGPARAAFVTPDPSLPPLGGEWVSDPISQMLDYGGVVQGMDVHLFGFTNIVSTDVGADEVITCNALLTAVVTSFPGEPMVTFAGPMQVVIFGKAGQTTGTYTAETVSLAAVAVGDPALMLRENPALASMGQVTVTDIGGGPVPDRQFLRRIHRTLAERRGQLVARHERHAPPDARAGTGHAVAAGTGRLGVDPSSSGLIVRPRKGPAG